MSEIYAIKKFLGVNNKVANDDLPAGVLSDAINVNFSNYLGSVVKSGGYQEMETAQTPFSGISVGMFYADTVKITPLIYAVTTTNFYVFNGSTWTNVTGAALTGTRDDIPSWTVGIDVFGGVEREHVLFTNGKDLMKRRPPAGGNFTNLQDVSTDLTWTAKHIVWWKNRLWCIHIIDGANEYSDRIYYSGIRDCEDWSSSTSGYKDISLGQSGKVNGAAVFRDKIVLLCAREIIIINYIGGTDIIKTESVPIEYGCIAPGSVLAVGNLLYYLSLVGVAVFNGSSVSYPTRDKWSIDIWEENAKWSVGCFIDNDILMSYPSNSNATENDKAVVFNGITQSISFYDYTYIKIQGFAGKALSGYVTNETINCVLLDDKIAYGYYQDGLGDIDNSSYISSFNIGWQSLNGDPSVVKRALKLCIVFLKPQLTIDSSGTITVYKNYSTSVVTTRTFSITGSGSVGNIIKEYDLNVDCRVIDIKIESDNSDVTLGVHAIYIIYDEFEGDK
jgi:hypothetical protein